MYPDYGKNSIINLTNSILSSYGKPGLYPPLDNLVLNPDKRLVFIVIDGLGMSFLEKHGRDSYIYSLTKQELTSVFPSTTSSALTSLMTGMAPLQHAMTGWFMYFRELATAAISLPFAPRFTDSSFKSLDVDISQILCFETIFTKINKKVKIISPRATINSAFSDYCFGEKDKMGYDTIAQCFQSVISAIVPTSGVAPTETIYAYIPHFDEYAHYHGINSPQTIEIFQQIDREFERLVKLSMGMDTTYIVTADHGLIDTTPDSILQLSSYPSIRECLILPLCGEPRVPYCYVRPQKLSQFISEVDKHLGAYCDRYELSELLEKKLFGTGTPHPKFFDRVGDQILIMRENYVLIDKVYHEGHKQFVGFHGGLSDDEMRVPLVVVQ
jgi:predicted AlkP superfamily pyrophosphatase or phosphodiesterase